MSREIQDIPPAPRTVRPRAVLWHCWPLAFGGFVLGVYGGLVTLMLVLAYGGKPSDDLRLDRDSRQTDAVVTRIDGGRPTVPGRPVAPLRPTYEFTLADGVTRTSRAFLADPELRVGARIRIEYAPDAPQINRPVGGRIAMVPRLHRISSWFFFAGVGLLVLWAALVWRLRRLMMHGDVAIATILSQTPIRRVSPAMLRVRYTFRDHRAVERTGCHWVRARSALGTRLAAAPERVPVIHSRSGRGVSRLVMADDFVVQQPHRDAQRDRRDP